MIFRPTRRGLVLGAVALAGCDRLQQAPSVREFIRVGELVTRGAQRTALFAQPMAREFKPSQISPVFRANGSTMPVSEDYQRHVEEGFVNWRLKIDGLVHNPVSFSLADLRAMNTRTQITRHDCVEGWSAIAQWTGVALKALLLQAGLLPQARFLVFHCADNLGGSADDSGLYYESIDLFDAIHPQTIIAFELNGKPLPVANGAPVRLRVERQLGYKQAKYVMRIEAASTLAPFGKGGGGFWEDSAGYEWYGGI
jgi:DMSO/TMAO reductase YedYZ molybdopterin-dependent catalytic subunit